MVRADWAGPYTRPRRSGRPPLPALAVAVLVVVFMLLLMPTARGGMTGTPIETVTVAPGDTVWSIAAAHAGSHDVREEVDAIVAVNHLDAVVVVAGQRLAVPQG